MKKKKTDEKFKEEIKQKFNGNMICLETYKGSREKLRFYCKICETEFVKEPCSVLHFKSCPFCYRKNWLNSDNFIKKLEEKNKNIQVIGEYKSSHTPIELKCKICNHEWRATPSDLIYRGYSCPRCAGHVVYEEEYKKRIKEKNENIEVIKYVSVNSSKNEFYCKKHDLYITRKTHKKSYICPKCALEARSGQNHYEWKGGTSSIYTHCRKKLLTWKKDILKKYEYKCAITGDAKNLVIHHIIPFHKILMDAHTKNNIEIKNDVSLYTKEEIKIIENYILEMHSLDIGIVITKTIHQKYHEEYGYDGEKDEWEEFYNNYINNDKKTT